MANSRLQPGRVWSGLLSRAGRSPRNVVFAFTAVVCAVVFANDLNRTLEGRSAAIDESLRNTANIALSVAQNATDAIRLADVSLADLVERVETEGTDPPQREALRRSMMVSVVGGQVLHDLTLLDEAGAIVVGTRQETGEVDRSALPFFRFHRSHPGRGVYIGAAIRRPSGEWIVTVSRRLQHADGGFAGVVVASIDLGYFRRLYDSFHLGRDGAIGLIRADGTLLVRSPSIEANIGTSLRDSSLFRDLLPKAPSGSQEETSPLDGVDRLLSYRRVDGYPLVVAVALGTDEQLAGWRADARNHLLATSVAVLLLAAVGFLLAGLVRLQADFQKASHSVMSERISLQTLIDGVPDYLWIKDTDSRFVVANKALAAHSGQATTEAMRGLTDFDLHSRDLAEEFRAAEREVLRSGQAMTDREEQVVDASGARRWLLSTKVPWRDSLGEIRGLVGIARDISGRKQHERALAESEARYRFLVEDQSELVSLARPDGELLFVNRAYARQFGRQPQEMVGTSLFAYIPADEHDAVRRHLRRVCESRDAVSGENRTVAADGSPKWIAWNNRALTDEAGCVTAIHSVGRDISERVAAEAALHASEERFRLLVGSIMDAAVYMLDPDGNVASWNPGAEAIKGYSPDEIIGQNFAVFFTHEDIVAGEPARLLAVARDAGRVAVEGLRVRKDGSVFAATVAMYAIRGEDGALLGYAKVTHDVGAQRIEEQQRAIIIEAAPTGMMIVNEAGEITLANARTEEIFGYPRGALTGQPVEILIPEERRAVHGMLRSGFTSGQHETRMSPDRQFCGRKRDGSDVLIEIMLSPVRTPRGRITVASLIDVTERTRLAEERREAEAAERRAVEATNTRLDTLSRHLARARDQAVRANQAKSRFLTGITHELRTPLNGVLGYAQLLQLEDGLTPVQAERVEAMLGAGKHLLGMINSVLDLSQVEAGKMDLHPADIDLPDLARACLDVVRPAAAAKGLRLELVPAPDMPTRLVADPTRLRQVVVNLLGNAVKFTPAGAVALRLLSAHGGAGVRLEVADTGPGIPEERRERLFREFDRLDADVVDGVEGAGLGLAIAARLVECMGGSMGYADNPGGGAVFWVELPASAAIAAAPDGPVPAAATATRRLSILVVDDVAMNRDIASAFLRLGGHDAVCVEGGEAAVASVAAGAFDVVLMDVRMPGMDGLEATRRIRALPAPQGRVPVLAVTAQAFAEQIEKCREAGMNDHVSKPFEQATLLRAVEAVVVAPGDPMVPRPEPAGTAVEPELVDEAVFAATAGFLRPADLEQHLETLMARCDALATALRKRTASAPELADAAHMLAGSAGMFGFARLAEAARLFEHAAQSGDADTVARAISLATTTEASLAAMRKRAATVAAVAT